MSCKKRLVKADLHQSWIMMMSFTDNTPTSEVCIHSALRFVTAHAFATHHRIVYNNVGRSSLHLRLFLYKPL